MKQLLCILLVLLSFSCVDKNHPTGEDLIHRSITVHGGWENYQNLDEVAFLKTTKLFLADGSLESEMLQTQSFRLKPSYLAGISWTIDTVEHLIVYDGMNASKLINDEVLRNSEESAKALRLAKSADYVFFQPFKLNDPKVRSKYEGKVVLMDSINASAVKIWYEEDDSWDQWTYYFDAEGMLVANSVAHEDRTSLIENLAFQEYKGLVFNKHRKSYFVDSLLNKKYLRAEYFYEILPN